MLTAHSTIQINQNTVFRPIYLHEISRLDRTYIFNRLRYVFRFRHIVQVQGVGRVSDRYSESMGGRGIKARAAVVAYKLAPP